MKLLILFLTCLLLLVDTVQAEEEEEDVPAGVTVVVHQLSRQNYNVIEAYKKCKDSCFVFFKKNCAVRKKCKKQFDKAVEPDERYNWPEDTRDLSEQGLENYLKRKHLWHR